MEKRYYNLGVLISFDFEGLTETEIDEYLNKILNEGLQTKFEGIKNLKVLDSYICRDRQSEKLENE